MIKRIQINDANDVRNARDHMKKIRDGISSGCITVSFDFRNDNSANLMLFASAEDTEVKCNAYATGTSEAGFLVPVTPDYAITYFDKLVAENKYVAASYAI